MNLFVDGTYSGPASLQNIVNPVETYEVIVDSLHISTSVNNDAANDISQLRSLTEGLIIEINNGHD